MTSNTDAENTNKGVALLVTVSLDPERRRLAQRIRTLETSG